jgi:hypothetical protein
MKRLFSSKSIQIALLADSLPSLFCRVRYAHTTKQTPRQKQIVFEKKSTKFTKIIKS